jgi:hypothetical protein
VGALSAPCDRYRLSTLPAFESKRDTAQQTQKASALRLLVMMMMMMVVVMMMMMMMMMMIRK